jgi:hypothetical protein
MPFLLRRVVGSSGVRSLLAKQGGWTGARAMSTSPWVKGECSSYDASSIALSSDNAAVPSEYQYILAEKKDKVALLTLNRPKVRCPGSCALW